MVVLGGVAAWQLQLSLGGLIPGAGGMQIARQFFAAALRPAFEYEADWVPPGAPALMVQVIVSLARTLAFAAAAMNLALVGALPLAYLSSSARWKPEAGSGPARPSGCMAVLSGPLLQSTARLLIALLRSIHELLWALILLAACGLSTASAVVAIALPYSGTLAKVFSEMLDEAPVDSARALRDLGATRPVVFVVGRLSRALPDMASYAFYRLECAFRSAAVLGFFGFPTLGYYLKASFDNLHFRETWTWIWALVLVVVLLEVWSAAMRRRFVA